MLDKSFAPLRLVYLAHSLRSDWNNGNAHFLRGLLQALVALGHKVTVLEPEHDWSIDHLRTEVGGQRSLDSFERTYPELLILTYASDASSAWWCERLADAQIVILHEWNPPALARKLLSLRDDLGFRLLFHDTHHRASSTPDQMRSFGLDRFNGIVAFGEALRAIYRERFGLNAVWTVHEAADTRVFKPLPELPVETEGVWIGNWGDGERAAELREFLVGPAAALRGQARFKVYGVRYPDDGQAALANAGIAYKGYLANLDAPLVYARARLTLHVPRQQYAGAMRGIPTIRVFEALACGIPLISAPWEDSEELFRPGDFLSVVSGIEMEKAMKQLLGDPAQAAAQAARGLETVLARHTCDHRARELTAICHEVLA